MKFIILFVLSVVAVANAGPGPKPPMFEYINQCKGSASDSDIAAIMSHPDKLPKPAYCVLGCAMKKSGMMTADNKIDMDNVKMMFSGMQSKNPDAYQGFISTFESCQPTVTTTDCLAAKSYYECAEPKLKQLMPKPGPQ